MAHQKTSLPLLAEADHHPCSWCQKAPDSPTQTDTLACSPFPVPSQRGAVRWSTISVQIHKCNCNSCMPPAQHEGQDLHVQLLIHSFLLHRMAIVGLGLGFALPIARSTQHAVSFSLQLSSSYTVPTHPNSSGFTQPYREQNITPLGLLSQNICHHWWQIAHLWPKRILHTFLWIGAIAVAEWIGIATFSHINYHTFERTASEHLCIS